MNRFKHILTTLAIAIVFPGILLTAPPPQAQSNSIDFETPSLGSENRRIIDPYIDENTGVRFTAESGSWGDEVVGLVKNGATSACVEPSDNNQKLGTGRSAFSDGSIGLSGGAIRASFPASLIAPMTVSVEFQTGANVPVRLRLFDSSNVEVASVSELALPAGGTCGFPGDPRAKKTISVTSSKPVAYAIMDLAEDGRVFVIDNFEFEVAPATDIITPTSSPTNSPAPTITPETVNANTPVPTGTTESVIVITATPALLEKTLGDPVVLVALIGCLSAFGVAIVTGFFGLLARRRSE